MRKVTISMIVAVVLLHVWEAPREGLASRAWAQEATASSAGVCYTCVDELWWHPCKWAKCMNVGMKGHGHCVADNSIFRCERNGCWVDERDPCGVAVRLDGSFAAPEEASEFLEAPAAYDHLVLGAVRRACGGVVVGRQYDDAAVERTRRVTERINL